ncbi:MAG TPA: PQQ-binding-like beta-propeller repeat protein, partial [Gaiellaceae bacterium]|nr:PQQ-binding-like beta-propeller repeat protein [Gaiellaceae bacterium]
NLRMRLLVTAAAFVGAALFATSAWAGDWPEFGFDAARTNAPAGSTGITATNVRSLVRQQVQLDGAVDSAAVYLHGASVQGATHDTFFVTTSYGRTIAIDAVTGTILWEYVPPGIAGWDHTAQVTTAVPAIDPSRRYLYTASPDGKIHKLSVADGSEVTSGGWPVTITLDPKHEKIGPGLNISGNLVLATTGGYIGDFPPYQGHVVSIDRTSGQIVHVFNALCSNRHTLMATSSCPASDAAIWGRGGAVVEPGTHNILVATGNGPWNGRTNWGDSVLELSPDAGKLLQAWTPTNADQLEANDLDLGSTSPAILTKTLILQSGKDGKLRLLNLARLNGKTSGPAPVKGGGLQIVNAPYGREVLASIAVWNNRGRVWAFVANFAGTEAFQLVQGSKPQLKRAWLVQHGGSSPVLAGGLLYVYDPLVGGLHVYSPTTGTPVTTLPTGTGHWNSPIVADGRVALPEGDSNKHRATSVLDIFRLPGAHS